MTTEELYIKSENFIRELLKKILPEDSKYFLFGSRAIGNFSFDSDIDIGVISGKLEPKTTIQIREILEESFVPWKVDIIDFSKVSDEFRKKSFRKDS